MLILKLTNTEFYKDTLYDYNVDGFKKDLFLITDVLDEAYTFSDANELNRKIKEIKHEFGDIKYEVIEL